MCTDILARIGDRKHNPSFRGRRECSLERTRAALPGAYFDAVITNGNRHVVVVIQLNDHGIVMPAAFGVILSVIDRHRVV